MLTTIPINTPRLSPPPDRRPSPRVRRACAMFGVSPTATPTWKPPVGRITRELLEAVGPGQVAAIVGPSGAGKSTILTKLRDRLGSRALTCPPEQQVRARRAAIVDLVGPTLEAGLSALSAVGLADATLIERTPAELSTGQRARLVLAIGLSGLTPERWLLIDELGSGLDLPTAESIAHALAKRIRSTGGRLVVATSRDELLDALQPEAVVWQPLGDEADLVTLGSAP